MFNYIFSKPVFACVHICFAKFDGQNPVSMTISAFLEFCARAIKFAIQISLMFKLVMQVRHVDQQKAARFERDIFVH